MSGDIHIQLRVQAEERVHRFFEYVQARDRKALSAMMHPEVLWLDDGLNQSYSSPGQVMEYLDHYLFDLCGTHVFQNRNLLIHLVGIDSCVISGRLEIQYESGCAVYEVPFSSVWSLLEGELRLIHCHVMERRNRVSVDDIPVPVVVLGLDDEYPIQYANSYFLSLTGFEVDELLKYSNGSFSALMVEEDLPGWKAQMARIFGGDHQAEAESRIICKDGSVKWMNSRGFLKTSWDGRREFCCFVTDITEFKLQCEKLRLGEIRYDVVLANSGITVFEYDIATGMLLLSEETAKIYGVPQMIEDGVSFLVNKEIIESASAEEYEEMYEKIKNGAPFSKCFVKARDLEGKTHDYELSLTAIYSKDGSHVRAIGVRRNVSQILSLQKEQEYGKNLVSDQVFIFEADITNDHLEHIHDGWRRSLGDIDDLNFSQVAEMITEHYIDKEHQDLLRKMISAEFITSVYEKGENLITFEYRRKAPEGNFIWYRAIINVIKDNLTGNLNIRFYHSNINEKKLREQKILDEQKLYETITAKAKLVYEVNFTANRLITGHENWKENYGIDISENYSDMIRRFSQKVLCPEDMGGLLNTFCFESVQNRRQPVGLSLPKTRKKWQIQVVQL